MIVIKKNPNGDTRTAGKDITIEEFRKANQMHRNDVSRTMSFFSERINTAGILHDFTKTTEEKLFYDNFESTIKKGTNFVEDQWYQLHIAKERHHLLSRCPDDVDLVDVLEMICDCVCAGLARSGEVRDLEIRSDILELAVKNTARKLADNIVVVESEESED